MGYYCNKCEEDITQGEYNFSKKEYNRALCRSCRPEKKTFSKASYKYVRLKHRPAPSPKPLPTPEAKKLAKYLKDLGWHPELEKWDGFKHIDIAVVEAKINIEVDGSHHNLQSGQAYADLQRTYYSLRKGFITIRIPNSLVRDDSKIKQTANFLDKLLNDSCDQLDDESEDNYY